MEPSSTAPQAGRRPQHALVWLAVGLIVVLAGAFRFYHLDQEPLHVDEIKQVGEVQSPWGDIVELSYRHTQPPLDYLVGKVVVSVAPATDFTQRVPAAMWGTLSVGLLMVILLRAGLPLAAIVAGLLAAVHPFLIHYSQYARPYALPLFMVMSTIAIYQHWRLGSRRWPTIVAFAIVASLALISHAIIPMLGFAVLGALGLIRALRANDRSLRAAARDDPLAIVVLPVVFTVVWIPSFFVLRHFGSGFLSGDEYRLDERLATSVERIVEFGGAAMEPIPLFLIAGVTVVTLLVRQVRKDLATSAYLWAPLLFGPLLFAFAHTLTTRESQFFADRYLMFLPFAFSALTGIVASALYKTAAGHSRLAKVGTGIVLAGLIVFGLLVPMVRASATLLTTTATADWKSVGEHITRVEEPGDVIITVDTRPFRRDAFSFGFMAAPRYYSGDMPQIRPDDVAVNPGTAGEQASRYHFVLFVPRIADSAELPPGWEVTEYYGFTILTSPSLETDEEREEAWWAAAEYMRGDVSVMTRLAGYALAERWFGSGGHHPWRQSLIDEADELGLSSLAEDWLARVDATLD